MRIITRSRCQAGLGAALSLLVLIPLLRSTVEVGYWPWVVVGSIAVIFGLLSLAGQSLRESHVLVWGLMCAFAATLLLSSAWNGSLVFEDALQLLAIVVVFCLGTLLRSREGVAVFVTLTITWGVVFSIVVILAVGVGPGLGLIQGRDSYLTTALRQALALGGLGGIFSSLLLLNAPGKYKVTVLVLLMITAIGLSLNHGRGAMGAGLVAVLAMFVLAGFLTIRRHGHWLTGRMVVRLLLLLFGAPVLVALMYNVATMDSRTESRIARVIEGGIDAEGRSAIWTRSLHAISEAPWIGGGVGASRDIHSSHAHNMFLHAVEDGGIGAGMGLGALILVIGWKATLRLTRDPQWATFAVAGITVAAFISAQTSSSLYGWLPFFLPLAICAGIFWVPEKAGSGIRGRRHESQFPGLHCARVRLKTRNGHNFEH